MQLRKRIASLLCQGALSIEMMAGIVVIAIVMSYAIVQMGEATKTNQATALARHLNAAYRAGQAFLDSNIAAMNTALSGVDYIVVERDKVTKPGGETVVLTGAANTGLKKYLPMNLANTRFGQDIKLFLYKGGENVVHGLVATSGGRIQEANKKKEYLEIARKAAQINGFGIRVGKNMAGVTVDKIVGPKDTWSFPFGSPDYGNIPASAIPEGQMAKAIFTSSAASTTTFASDDFLYRVEVPGKPELNTMQVDLKMDGKKIDNAGDISLKEADTGGHGLTFAPHKIPAGLNTFQYINSVCNSKPAGYTFVLENTANNPEHGYQHNTDLSGMYVCLRGPAGTRVPRLISDSLNSSSVRGVTIAKAGDKIKKPVCPAGATPSIFVQPVAFTETYNRPYPITAIQTYARNATTGPGEPPAWTVYIRVKATDHDDESWADVDSGPDFLEYNYVTVWTLCQQNFDPNP